MGPFLLLLLAGLFAIIQPTISDVTARMMMAVLFETIVMAAIVWMFGRLVRAQFVALGLSRRDAWIFAAVAAAVCAVGALFLHRYFAAEQDIKVYDSSNYWIRVLEDKARIAQSIPEYLRSLRYSLAQEYSNVAVFPLLLVSDLFGVEFTGYCQSVFVAYYLPACILLSLVALRLAQKGGVERPGVLALSVCFVVCALCPLLFWPLILGYLDVAGVLIVSAMLLYAFDWDSTQFSVRRNLVLSMLSLLLLLTRRWYAYYIVGFYASIGIVQAISLATGRRLFSRALWNLVSNMLMIAGVACVCILALNPDIFLLFFGSDYSVAYEAFKSNTMAQAVYYMANHIGYLWVALFFFGAMLFIQKKETRGHAAWMLGAMFLAGLLFLSVQDMGPHHEYLVSPTLLVFICAFVAYGIDWASGASAKRWVGLGIAAACVANFALAFVPQLSAAAYFAGPQTSTLYSYPKTIKNHDMYHVIQADLLEKTGGKPDSVYVVGEGEVFNPEYLRRANLPAEVNAALFAQTNNTADLRDGFPSQLFFAEYVLMIDPFETDFARIQQVGYQVYDMFLHDPTVKTYYELDATYSLEEHKALLYRKTRPVDKALVDVLKARLRTYYPDNAFVYEPDYFIALAEYDEHMGYYNFWDRFLVFHKLPGEDISFPIHDTQTFSAVSFEMSVNRAGLTLVIENQAGEIYRTPLEQSRTAYSAEIAGSEFLRFTITDSAGEEPGYADMNMYYSKDSLR